MDERTKQAEKRLTALITEALGVDHPAMDDLAVLILSARAALAATQAGWISVKDRLPEDETVVLVWGTLHSMLCEDSAPYPARYSRGWWLHKGNAVLSHVTHWMPLPAAPESSEKEDGK